MIKTTVYSLAAIILLFSGLVAAESKDYQIELIIFSQNRPNSETFEQTASTIEWPNNLTEQSAYPQAQGLLLAGNYAALAKNPSYRPVLHAAWIQTVEENSPGSPVHIHSDNGEINGYLQMQRGETLQLTVDLEYSPARADISTENLVYRLTEQRQFQLNDLHYFDHPKFGAITKITVIDKPQ